MNIFETILAISGASLGFRCITGKGMILYFLRRPFDLIIAYNKEWNYLNEKLTYNQNQMKNRIMASDEKRRKYHENEAVIYFNKLSEMKRLPNRYDWLIYCMKPIILCSTCMASVHTLIWFHYLTGVNPFTTWDTVLVMLIVAFLNTILFATHELILSLKEK